MTSIATEVEQYERWLSLPGQIQRAERDLALAKTLLNEVNAAIDAHREEGERRLTAYLDQCKLRGTALLQSGSNVPEVKLLEEDLRSHRSALSVHKMRLDKFTAEVDRLTARLAGMQKQYANRPELTGLKEALSK